MLKLKNIINGIPVNDMKQGQIAKIISSGSREKTFNGSIVIRVYDDRLVSLNGRDTWDNINILRFIVEVLPNGTLLEITGQ